MAQDFIEDRLVSPGTAKWQSIHTNDVTKYQYLGNGKYRIVSYVDSQNVFGGMIRQKFTCVVQYAGDNNWSLESLVFDE